MTYYDTDKIYEHIVMICHMEYDILSHRYDISFSHDTSYKWR